MNNKKHIILLVLILMGFTAQSQVLISLVFGDKLNSDKLEFGLEGGFNWSDISGLDADERLSAFNLGFYFDFRLKNQWHLYTGVLVKAKLGDRGLSPDDLAFLEITPNAEEDGTYSQVINYFVVPALLKYNFKNRMYLEAGPQFGIMYNSWVEFESNLDNKDIKTKDYNKDKINPLDAGITFGTGYKLMSDSGMTLGLKYYYGLTNVYKGVSGSNNSSLFLKLNMPIGAHKKKDTPKSD
jgi:hypothetical protein